MEEPVERVRQVMGFAVRVRRRGKGFPLRSGELVAFVGSRVQE
ncbi:hypothetical protein ABT063_47730 [Streptomyces sp. NPDC002838]